MKQRESCNESVDILRQLATTSRYQDALAHLLHDGVNLLSTGLLQVVSTSCNKSANDKLQQA